MSSAAPSAPGSSERTAPVAIVGGYVLDAWPAGARHVDLLVEGGRIARVAEPGSLDPAGVRRLDARGCLILPGLTNAHTHSPENLIAGFCDGMQLDAWLSAVWSRVDRLAPEAIGAAVLLGAAQMLKRGVTAVVDHFRQTPMSLAAIESAHTAYRRSGMRAMIAVMLRDRVGRDGRLVGVPARAEPISIAQARELWTAAAERCGGGSRVQIALGPSGATRCSDAMLALAVELAAKHSLCLHTHVAETRPCADTAQQLYGCRTVRHLQELGFLGPRTSLAHCVWVDNAEIELIAGSGAVVVHNPVSNMALGAGIAPVAAMREAGVPIAVGTDGAASNGGQDLVESIKYAALLPRCGMSEPAKWPSAEQVLKFAIDGGRTIFGLGAPVIASGAIADLAVLPVGDDSIDSAFDPVRQFVYGAASYARHVLVEGEPVVLDGAITTFDESALQAEVRRARKRFVAINSGE